MKTYLFAETDWEAVVMDFEKGENRNPEVELIPHYSVYLEEV